MRPSGSEYTTVREVRDLAGADRKASAMGVEAAWSSVGSSDVSASFIRELGTAWRKVDANGL